MNDVLLQVQGLSTLFSMEREVIRAVDDVSFFMLRGESCGIVGESGCGKSVTALSIMRLVPAPGRISSGAIIFEDQDLMHKTENEMRSIRGNSIAMVFQEPMTALNPVFTIGWQLCESLKYHKGLRGAAAKERAKELLDLVRMPLASQRINEYPHQLSGGMRQRAMIAMALACEPKLLICDEPTTALDVTVQAQILDLIEDLQKEIGMAVIMITHDLGVISRITQRVMVMYAGKIVETNTTERLLSKPLHPYTAALLKSVPKISDGERVPLYQIRGSVINLSEHVNGCMFAPRCDYATDECYTCEPQLYPDTNDTWVRCFRYRKEATES